MLRSELLEIISNKENSGVEFKRDDVRPEKIAKEIVAFLNLQGGRLLLGVEDDGTISGLTRPNTQEWILNIFRDKIHSHINPYYEEVRFDDERIVGIVTVPSGISKPYVRKHDGREEIFIRILDRSELASREEQMRLFQSGGLLHIELLPVAGTSIANLDLDRLYYYLSEIIHDPEIPDQGDRDGWEKRLLGMGLLAEDGHGNTVCSIAGLICFGIHPRRFLPQSGLRLLAFAGIDKDYQAQLDIVLDAPLVGRWGRTEAGNPELVDEGLIEKFINAIDPVISREPSGIDENFRRERSWLYPREAVRESVINSLAHRDWTRSVDIEIVNYINRLEVISPGRLPNSMTVEKMKAGQRSPRNPIIMDILRDYGYVDARGMGVRTKIIPLMREQNGTEPEFEANEDYLKTVLFLSGEIEVKRFAE